MDKLSIGDKVVVGKVTMASLNLYQATKKMGMPYIKCPCNVKATDACTIENTFKNGYLLRSSLNFLTVAHGNDLRKI